MSQETENRVTQLLNKSVERFEQVPEFIYGQLGGRGINPPYVAASFVLSGNAYYEVAYAPGATTRQAALANMPKLEAIKRRGAYIYEQGRHIQAVRRKINEDRIPEMYITFGFEDSNARAWGRYEDDERFSEDIKFVISQTRAFLSYLPTPPKTEKPIPEDELAQKAYSSIEWMRYHLGARDDFREGLAHAYLFYPSMGFTNIAEQPIAIVSSDPDRPYYHIYYQGSPHEGHLRMVCGAPNRRYDWFKEEIRYDVEGLRMEKGPRHGRVEYRKVWSENNQMKSEVHKNTRAAAERTYGFLERLVATASKKVTKKKRVTTK